METTHTTETARLIAFRVRKGNTAEGSARLLEEIAKAHTGDNLAYALHYNGFVGESRAAGAAHALEVERTNEHVSAVAALLPFEVELFADMGANYSGHAPLVIDLGTRGDDDDPHDRAGIEESGARPTWWIETEGGATFHDSGLTSTADPARIAQWISDMARVLGCPAAEIDNRPDWGTVSRWADAHKAAGTWPPSIPQE